MDELTIQTLERFEADGVKYTPRDAEITRRDRIYADLAEAVGLTGAAIDDLKRLTAPMLLRTIRRAWELGEHEFRDNEAKAATVALNKLLEEIRGK